MKLCERLERYISGSLAEVFNSQTNIKLDNRLVVFDIKDLPESLRKIMMLIISNFVKNQVMAKPEKRLLIIDEGWLLLEHEESARFGRWIGTPRPKILSRRVNHLATSTRLSEKRLWPCYCVVVGFTYSHAPRYYNYQGCGKRV